VKRFLPVLALLLAVGVVAVLACFVTGSWTGRLHSHPTAHHADAHHWIHTQLGLTTEQEAQLVLIEQRYDDQRRNLSEIIHAANIELGQALVADQGESPQVKAALAKIQEAQGQLQDATLQHVFEMKPVLKPEQYDKLLNLTAKALSQIDHAQ
jgi:Spy/CpxP family protein refolding chaperone